MTSPASVSRRLLVVLVGAALAGAGHLQAEADLGARAARGLPEVSPTTTPVASVSQRQIDYRHWNTDHQWRSGVRDGVKVRHGHLLISRPTATTTIGRHRYAFGTWTSGWVRPGFRFTELVPSWAASTPTGTLIQVQVRGIGRDHSRSSWDDLGRWADRDSSFERTSLGTQGDDLARVATDTWEANGPGLRAWQARVLLLRRTSSSATPHVGTLGAMSSRLPDARGVTTSAPGVARGISLRVPRYSQMIHRGQYPEYGGGGEAWCSPTSTSMVLAYYRKLPRPSAYRWVDHSYTDRVVDHSARMTYDYGYDGTGNWPFNTAYAAGRTGSAFVTRFRSLRGVEMLIKAGIPVVTSITFGRGELSGAPISASNGHLVVVVGFTRAGNVIVNDPAAAHRSGVRRTYDRGQFEDAWLKRYRSGGSTHGSGGLGYVIRDAAHPLPARVGNTNW